MENVNTKVIRASRNLEETILELESLKYRIGRMGEEGEDYATDIEYKILVELRTLHSYLKELGR